MANGNTHSLVAALTVGALDYMDAQNKGDSARPLIGAGLAAVLTNLPDLLEPAIHPHHRQFCHSIAFGGMVTLAAYELYRWKPETDGHKFLRYLFGVACGAYLIHLAVDALSSRSLPMVGK